MKPHFSNSHARIMRNSTLEDIDKDGDYFTAMLNQ
jgi:hypothetical protein